MCGKILHLGEDSLQSLPFKYICNLKLKTSRCDQHPTSNLGTFGKAMAIYVALKATC